MRMVHTFVKTLSIIFYNLLLDLPLYIVHFLSERHNHVSPYCLEYTCALLMNLCLHDKTRSDLLNMSAEVVYMLNDFIKSSHTHCLSYINGVMYSLFIEDDIRIKANENGIQKSLLAVIDVHMTLPSY